MQEHKIPIILISEFVVPLALRNQDVTNSKCDIASIDGVNGRYYCADGATSNCEKDSGGFIQSFADDSITGNIVGIFSFGCERSTHAYTKIAYYLDWIESHVWPNDTIVP